MCYSPINIKNEGFPEALKIGTTAQVPCGRCIECRKKMLSSWKYRINKENEACGNVSCFVTLTYDDQYLPYSDNGLMTLNYRDVQNFHKRLRKKGHKFKYLVAGEYGSRTHRPHYHAIYMGINNKEILENTWNNGLIDLSQDVNDKTIAYTLKYILKSSFRQFKGNKKPDELDDRLPEKGLFSQGLGLSAITPALTRYFKTHLDAPLPTRNGNIALPRYLKNKMLDEHEILERSVILLPEARKIQYERENDPQFELNVKNIYRQTYNYLKKQKAKD